MAAVTEKRVWGAIPGSKLCATLRPATSCQPFWLKLRHIFSQYLAKLLEVYIPARDDTYHFASAGFAR